MLERHHTHKIGVRKGWRLTLQTRHNQCKKKRNKLTIYNFHTMSTLYSVLTRKLNDNENTNRNCRFFLHIHMPHAPLLRANEEEMAHFKRVRTPNEMCSIHASTAKTHKH